MSPLAAPPEPPLDRIRAHLSLVANRDLYDEDHIDAVADLSARLGRSVGLGDAEIADVEQVARLRDVGKAMVPIAILRKREPLDDAEWALLRAYPEHSAQLVAGTPGWAHLVAPVRACNERWDGEGYPDGLAGEAIPRASRITYVAQAYLAMLSDRPYRPALPAPEATVELVRMAGSQFCPQTVTALVELLISSRPTRGPTPAARGPRPAAPRRLVGAIRAAGGLAGVAVGLAVALPLPDAGRACPPSGEGLVLCQVQNIAAPAITAVALCGLLGLVLVSLALRIPAVRAAHGARRAAPAPGPPPFASDPDLIAASWGVVYDDEDTPLRAIGRRRFHAHAGAGEARR